MTQIEIGSKWKHKTSDDVYTVTLQYSHRVILVNELTGEIIRVSLGHLNPEGFDEYQRVQE